MARSTVLACAAVFLSACISDSPAGSSTTSSSSSGGTVAGNLLANSDFEIGGCASWTAGNALVSDEPSAVHGGKLACLVCIDRNAGTSIYGVSQRVPVTGLTAGVVYRASAWVRTPTTGKTATELHAGFIIDGGDDYTDEDNVAGSEIPDPRGLTAEYHQVQSAGLKYEPKAGATSVFVQFINRKGDEGCFIIDDAVLTPQ